MNTINFKNRQYVVVEVLACPKPLVEEGLAAQYIIRGARGATRLMQVYQGENGDTFKTIDQHGRVEQEFKAAE